ncbi:MAG: hypothetical protein P9X26_02055 [Candidatus Stygibacter frigidus]|nr:hypothetical protein [Candidatus Stygibacter frigidus]
MRNNLAIGIRQREKKNNRYYRNQVGAGGVSFGFIRRKKMRKLIFNFKGDTL